MPVLRNIQQYECDRCGYKDLALSEDDPVLKSWRMVKRLNSAEDVSEMVLCPRCAPDWDRLMAQHDEDVTKFMAERPE